MEIQTVFWFYRVAHKFISSICMGFFVLLVSTLFLSCDPNEPGEPPTIQFSADTASIYQDTAVTLGTVMQFRIEAHSKDAVLTNLVVSKNDGTQQNLLDTGIYDHDFYYSVNLIKGSAESETWTFTVMNKDRQKSSVSVVVNLQPGAIFAPVIIYDSIILGAQNNLSFGNWFSLETGLVYSTEEAFLNQELIDILYYYDVYESTLSSPNENDAPSVFGGTFGLANWTTKNESNYNLTLLTENDFNETINDSLLIVSYDQINAKRKGKFVQEGQVWAFRNYQGRLGLILIHNITGTTDGSMVFSIKVQENL